LCIAASLIALEKVVKEIVLPKIEEGLDPPDWAVLNSTAHQIIDDAISHVRDVGDRPLWQEMPDTVCNAYTVPLPLEAKALEDVYAEIKSNLFHIRWAAFI
jgi:hypothetical protein